MWPFGLPYDPFIRSVSDCDSAMHCTTTNVKARSHGTIFVNATVIWKMGCLDVYETVHMVHLQYCIRTCVCVCDVTHGMGFIPILCNCDVWFQYIHIANCIYTHGTMWTFSQNHMWKNAVTFRKNCTVWMSLYNTVFDKLSTIQKW